MRNEIEVFAFEEASLRLSIQRFLRIPETVDWSTDQVDYLCSYLADPEVLARTVVFEKHYVDRHYMEEYSMYFAKCLSPPPNACARIHVFSTEFDADRLEEYFGIVSDDDSRLATLAASYLGFIVIRPLEDAPIGRTMLKPYPKASTQGHSRAFDPLVSATVHLAPLELKIESLPFQQQDSRVGACATAALWSALARVARTDGGRSPTPGGITDAAVRYQLPDGRAYPSDGLRLEQICEALRSHGSPPELLRMTCKCTEPCTDPVTKGALIRGYLRSKIPVILSLVPLEVIELAGDRSALLVSETTPHSVCAVGFSNDSIEARPHYIEDYLAAATPLVSAACEYPKLYLHDDRYGPYTRAGIWRTAFYEDEGDAELQQGASRGLVVVLKDAPWVVSHAIVPLYPKVRTSLTELIAEGTDWAGLLADNLGLDRTNLRLDARLMRSGDYMSALRRGERGTLNSALKARFAREACLSRYVGLVEYWIGTELIADLLWDTTDRIEESSAVRLLAGGVVYRDDLRDEFRQLVDYGNVAVV